MAMYSFCLLSVSSCPPSLRTWDSKVGKRNCNELRLSRPGTVEFIFVYFYHRLTVPPNTFAALTIAITVWFSVRYDRIAVFIIITTTVAIIGYLVLLTATKPGAQYVGVHLAAAGIYTGNALVLSWPGENVAGQTKRAVAVAMQVAFGDIGAIAAVLIYRPNFAGHEYRKPHIIAIGYLLSSGAVAAYLWFWLSRENKKKAAIQQSESSETYSNSIEERQRLGDRHILYRYVY